MQVFKSILVVCSGNICRSPIAEQIFRRKLKASDIYVSSAGVGAVKGRPMDSKAMDVLKEHGFMGRQHHSRPVDSALLHQADLVLAMERHHMAVLARSAPEIVGRMFLLNKWTGGRDVIDPFRQSRAVFRTVYKDIEQGVSSWLGYL